MPEGQSPGNHACRPVTARILCRRDLPGAQLEPKYRYGGDHDERQDGELHHAPAKAGQQRARRERRQGNGPEDQKIVERLDFGLLARIIRAGKKRCRANEQEVPADAEKHERRPEIEFGHPQQINAATQQQQPHPDQQDSGDPESGDQMSGEKARHIHAERVPLDNESGVGESEAAAEHGDRRRCHDRRHDPIADHPGGNGDDKDRLGGDFDQGSAATAQRGCDRLRQPHETEQGNRGQKKRRDYCVAAGKHDGGEQITRPPRGLWSEQSGDDATGQDQGDRLGTECVIGDLRCRKAILLNKTCIDTDQHGPGAEHREIGRAHV